MWTLRKACRCELSTRLRKLTAASQAATTTTATTRRGRIRPSLRHVAALMTSDAVINGVTSGTCRDACTMDVWRLHWSGGQVGWRACGKVKKPRSASQKWRRRHVPWNNQVQVSPRRRRNKSRPPVSAVTTKRNWSQFVCIIFFDMRAALSHENNRTRKQITA